jgi:hypothetical protein
MVICSLLFYAFIFLLSTPVYYGRTGIGVRYRKKTGFSQRPVFYFQRKEHGKESVNITEDNDNITLESGVPIVDFPPRRSLSY